MKRTIGVYVDDDRIQELDDLARRIVESDKKLTTYNRSDLIRCALDLGLEQIKKELNNL